MRKRLFLGVLVTIAVSFAVVVTTGAASSRPGAKSSAQVLPSSSCLPVVYHGSGKPKFLIASDLPLQGANRPQTTQMTKAIQFVLAGQGYKAGAYSVGYQACDDSTAQAGKWDAAKCTANARAYAADKSVIGVIGTFNSGCAKLVIPILNRAPNGPLAMITPANTYPGLTHAAPPITVAGEPGVYYPTGKRNYARVVATDDFQGPADALMAQKLGVKKVYVLTDNETYGEGIAKAFLLAAQKLGMQIVGNEVWDPKASDYSALATKIAGSGAQGVFFGGIVCNNGAALLKGIRAGVGANVKFVGPDGWTPFSAVGAGGDGMYVSVAGLPNNALGATGKAFIKAFVKYQKRQPDPYAVYAAQAAVVLLQDIASSNGTRSSVAAGLFKVKVKNGILGTFRIDKNGDTTLKGITIYLVQNGNGTAYTTIYPPVSLTK